MDFPSGGCRELLGCHRVPSKTSYAVFVRAAVLPRGYVGIYWRQLHKKIVPFYASRGRWVFSQLSKIRVELIRRTGCPVGFTVEVWELMRNFIAHFTVLVLYCAYSRMIAFGNDIIFWIYLSDISCLSKCFLSISQYSSHFGTYVFFHRFLNRQITLPVIDFVLCYLFQWSYET